MLTIDVPSAVQSLVCLGFKTRIRLDCDFVQVGGGFMSGAKVSFLQRRSLLTWSVLECIPTDVRFRFHLIVWAFRQI